MSFSQMAQILREQNKEKIVLIKVGVFFIAIEEDAVLLNVLNCSCLAMVVRKLKRKENKDIAKKKDLLYNRLCNLKLQKY